MGFTTSMYINSKNIDNTNFKQIYFIKPLKELSQAHSQLDLGQLRRFTTKPAVALKKMVLASDFFEKLGTKTDVYVSENKQGDNFHFNAYFSNPYTLDNKKVEEIEIISKAGTLSSWHNVLEYLTPILSTWYPNLQTAFQKNRGTFAFMNMATVSLKQFDGLEDKMCKLM